ncbi:cysteine proteinase [Xylona heveae TC161]|uniref:Cysteine proteinase n=1 Tax=Xylona heveae (strain CBS 132557 / TC161) TaxID=1328760 RepID=A0A164ZEL2_XYLHT|nr:cysteine proteinase [Xylona heveae TC161]KZF19005.1 cysteine proteinase [Xylona heveae TC161]
MEELQARQRKELRDLQSRITQKKKSATKKTRKGVNDECANLERETKERHEKEIAALLGQGNEEEISANLDNMTLETSHEPTNTASQPNGEAKPAGQVNGTSEAADDVETTANGEEQSRARKPNRQKARLARRAAEQEALAAQAAEEAANLPNMREKEKLTMMKEFAKHGLREQEIRPDGHCLYSAVADQLTDLGLGLKPKIQIGGTDGQETLGYKVVRRVAADFITQNSDDFVPFLEEPLDEYTHKIRDTAEWGGQLELLALSKAYGVEINVLQGDGRVEKVEPGSDAAEQKLWLAYYRHNFGLGEHYNSLRKES